MGHMTELENPGHLIYLGLVGFLWFTLGNLCLLLCETEE